MKKITAAVLTIIIILTALCGCSQTADAPDGMQLVRGSDALGYYLYSPIGWIVASQGKIASSYVSTIDSTSVTLVEAKMPEGTIKEYFEAAKADFTFDIDVKNEGESTLVAKAGEHTDEGKIRKASERNMDYVLVEKGAVLNWFDIDAPEGRFSLNDKISDIMESKRLQKAIFPKVRMI